MEKRIPASMRTRHSLSELIEGRLASSDGLSELVKLATRLIIEEGLAGGSTGPRGPSKSSGGWRIGTTGTIRWPNASA